MDCKVCSDYRRRYHKLNEDITAIGYRWERTMDKSIMVTRNELIQRAMDVHSEWVSHLSTHS